MKRAFGTSLLTTGIACISSIFLISIGVFTGCKEKEAVELQIKQLDAERNREMAKSISSLVNPDVAEGFSLKLWAVDSLVADPISIHIDDKGRLFYSKTNRRKISEFDIRSHPDWEIASIKMQTVEDRRAFIHEELAPENSDKNQWLPDLNGDGSHDWRDLKVEKENVFRLEDTDGDGLADRAQLVVKDFNEEISDVAGALLTHGKDIFVGVAPDLWRLRDTNGDGMVDEKTSISHGYGVHIGFGGHNMSGLTLGPDGRIYWGIGDIGFNGIGPDGKEWKYPNQGVIARANPDGSDFEIFAAGVRNTHEFVFDEYNNLISVDNDGDHRGERERLVYLVNGSDTGWRINWQFGKYRDPGNNSYKVWMDEGMHLPRHEGQPAFITPCIENFVNGPTGMLYNPGTALSPKWKNTFFVAEFAGNPARSGIHAFQLKPDGASFALSKHEQVLGGILGTGMDFGPDGALYFGDWIDGWVNKDYGRIWKLDDEEGEGWSERKQTREILARDFEKLSMEELGGFLYNPDMRVRRKAQFELAERGNKGLKVFEEAIAQRDNQLARIHAIVGVSQIARMQKMGHAALLVPLLRDQDPEIRAQAAKWLGDIRYKEAGKALVPLLEDEEIRVRFFAAEALGRIAYEPATDALIRLLETNKDEDAYIRHAASLALSRVGAGETLGALAGHTSVSVRMGAVLALRRLGHFGIAAFLEDEEELIVTEAARAINDDFSIEEALPALGNVLKDSRFTNEALIRRAINANLRVGTEEAMQNLITYMSKEDVPSAMRAEAMEALSTWTKPSVLDRVDGRYRGEIEREGTLVRAAAAGNLMDLLAHREPVLRLNAVKALGRLEIEEASETVFDLLKGDQDAKVRMASLRSLVSMQSERVVEGIESALADREKSVRVVGLDLLTQLDISKDLMVDLLAEVIDKRTTEEKQAALLTLGTVPVEYSSKVFDRLLEQMDNKKLPGEIHLELGEAIENTKSAELINRYKSIEEGLSEDHLLASYQGSLYGGDVLAGRRIFFQHATGQCIKCHSYDDFGGNAGPRLNGIGAELSREELLEALIDPSKRLAPGFGVVTLELENEQKISAVLQEENSHSISLKMGNKPDTVIMKEHIVHRRDAASSMPDMKEYLTRREIRDLVSFLTTLKKDG